MGKLLNPDDRSQYLYIEDPEIKDIKDLSEKHGLTILETVEILKFLEIKRGNSLFLSNGNAHDDQMMGIGELLTSLNKNVKSLVTILKDKR